MTRFHTSTDLSQSSWICARRGAPEYALLCVWPVSN